MSEQEESSRDKRDQEILDATFLQMTQDLDLNPTGLSAVVVSTLSDLELLAKLREVKEELLERRELVYPTTETGKDLQTNYHAYMLELRRRGLK